jgi:hypothetical protein
MLAEFIKFLVTLGEEKVLSISLDGLADRKRVFVKEALEEVMPEEACLDTKNEFGSIVDFASGVDKFGVKGQTVVFVNSTGATAVIKPRCIPRQSEKITFKPYYSALPNAAAGYDYPAFIELLDAFTGKITEEAQLRAILKVIKFQKKAAVTLEDKGGFIRLLFTESQDVETGNQVDIPKYITFTGIPYYDPLYTDIALKYRLSVSLDQGLKFKLLPMPDLDERDLKATERAICDLHNLVGDAGFPVYRAAEPRRN